jgi:type II secretory pathway component PulF
MPRFHFRAVTAAGEFPKGEIEAQSQAAVIEHLRSCARRGAAWL